MHPLQCLLIVTIAVFPAVKGKLLKVLPSVKLPSVYVEPLPSGEEDDAVVVARVSMPELPVAQRKGCFAEVELGIGEDEALCEARRCLRCDLDFTQPL
ncbi:MAG: hypothetical protein NTV86_02780 [Planctomycetota bacterium]|nr:hypothetical protein [Planctomycetota bacterium]